MFKYGHNNIPVERILRYATIKEMLQDTWTGKKEIKHAHRKKKRGLQIDG
jgi:hypothetical protein